MGNPEFCIKALEELLKNKNIDLKLVCGGLDKKVGRGHHLTSPASIEFAKKNGIQFLQCENINKSELFFELVSKMEVDLIIVFAFSHFLGKRILDLPKIGCFNIHTSLLPKYRGSSPIHYALLNGDTETGITIQKMVKKMDAGDILVSQKISIEESDDFFSLCKKFHDNLDNSINTFVEKIINHQFDYVIQDENEVSFAPLINKDDGLICFESDNFITVKNKIRALKAWPGVFCHINNQRYKIHEIEKSSKSLNCGAIAYDHKNIYIGLKSDSIILTKLQPPGKKPMNASDFINGLPKGIILAITENDSQEIQ